MIFPKTHITLLFILFTTIHIGLAQQKPLKITVRSADKTTLPGATVQLKNRADLSRVASTTNGEGMAVFNRLPNGMYSLNISYIGFKPVDTLLRITSVARNFEFVMTSGSVTLEKVEIVAKRPLIRQDGDKMVIDPAPLVNTATNTLEVLESTPGLYVDPDGGIFLNSSTAAVIYINGREQKMSNEDISTILRSLPPNSVEKIEVLRSPSTKYDAASSGGIINIVLKKGVKIGRSGSVNLGMNQGVYGNRFLGFSLNNSGNNTTSYLNFNFSINRQLDELNSIRYLDAGSQLIQSSQTRNRSTPLFLGYGVNYEVKQGISLSYDGRINAGLRNTDTHNRNAGHSAENILLSESDNFTDSHSRFLSLQQDFGMMIKFDTLGSGLDTKLSYSYSRNSSEQDYHTDLLFPSDTTFSGNGNNLQNRHFLVLQSDLTYGLPFKLKLETGIKSSWQQLGSSSGYFVDINGQPFKDLQRTNAFRYIENINSVYAQASRLLFAGLNLKAGVRLEQTYMNGHQALPGDTSFLVNRADLFPYVYLSRRVLKIMGAELFGYMIYRKTISRPGYQELNPYIRFVDQFLYESGNPALEPQFTDNVELNISYDDMPVFAIGRNITRNVFSSVMYQDHLHENVLVRTYDNLGTNTDTYFRGMVGIPPGGRYFFALGAQYNLSEYDGMYENQPMKYSRGSWRFFTFQSLTLFTETKLTVNGFMMVNGQWNFYEMKNFGQLNIGLTQTLYNKKLSISLNARDILKTMLTEFAFNQGAVSSSGDRYSDNRRFGINIRYNFGLKKKDEKKGLPTFEVPEL